MIIYFLKVHNTEVRADMEMYKMLSRDELKTIKAALEEEYAKAQSLGLKLDMSRGKPAPAQLDLAMGILDAVNSTNGYR